LPPPRSGPLLFPSQPFPVPMSLTTRTPMLRAMPHKDLPNE
jgi:hypothetical protein